MNNKDPHFDKVFWMIVGCLALAFGYIFLVTFSNIPKDNIRFADQFSGFLTGSVIAGCLSYFITSNPASRRPVTPGEAGETTADITASITTTPKEEKEDVI